MINSNLKLKGIKIKGVLYPVLRINKAVDDYQNFYIEGGEIFAWFGAKTYYFTLGKQMLTKKDIKFVI